MPDTHQGQGSRLPRRPRKDVWAQHMPIIRRLYLDEARPLREVMDTMENEHGFRASIKGYKYHLRSLGVRKYVKLQDRDKDDIVRQVIASLEVAPAVAKPSPIRLASGQVVNVDRLTTYLRRSRAEGAQLSWQRIAPYLRAASGAPGPAALAVRSPDALCAQEAVFHDVRSYILGQLDEEPGAGQMFPIWSGFYSALVAALNVGKLDEALFFMRRAPERLTSLLNNRPRNIVIYLLMFLVCTTCPRPCLEDDEAEQLFAASRSLLRFGAVSPAASAASRYHGPLRGLLRNLAGVADLAVFRSLVLRAWKLCCETWGTPGARGGYGAPSEVLTNWADFCGSADPGDVPSDLGGMIEREIANAKMLHGPHSQQYAGMLYISNQYIMVADKGRGLIPHLNPKVIEHLTEVLRCDTTRPTRCNALAELAEAYRFRGEKEVAVRYMRESIEEQGGWRDYHDAMVIVKLGKLEDWLTAWGDNEQAAAVAHERKALIAASLRPEYRPYDCLCTKPRVNKLII